MQLFSLQRGSGSVCLSWRFKKKKKTCHKYKVGKLCNNIHIVNTEHIKSELLDAEYLKLTVWMNESVIIIFLFFALLHI